MNQDQTLKLQAWVDGELSSAESRRIADLVAADPEAARLAAQLRDLKAACLGAELDRSISDSREFYWSKIRRQIERESQSPAPARVSPWLARWRSLRLPIIGLAAAACVMLVTVKQAAIPGSTEDEVTSTDDSMDTMTFHDQSSDFTVVWLQDTAAPKTKTISEQSDEPFESD